MLLKVSLQLYSVSQDRAELGLLLNRAEAQRRAGLADPLTCALEGLAHEANGSLEKAVERLREAVRGAPENQAFRRDLTRLEAAGGLRK
jgi:Flp pilus assembly protein TadD